MDPAERARRDGQVVAAQRAMKAAEDCVRDFQDLIHYLDKWLEYEKGRARKKVDQW